MKSAVDWWTEHFDRKDGESIPELIAKAQADALRHAASFLKTHKALAGSYRKRIADIEAEAARLEAKP